MFHIKYLATALECYVCANQSDNAGKCLNTIKTCEPDEDVCKTEIRWGMNCSEMGVDLIDILCRFRLDTLLGFRSSEAILHI